MDKSKAGFESIDAYIATFPLEVRKLLVAMRATIRAAAPEAVEKISYQMPTFWQHGNLVHFAALKRHIGFYPTPSGIEAYKDELSRFVSTKGALQFPMDEPLPLDLVGRIVRFRVAENRERALAKAAKTAAATKARSPRVRGE